MRLKANSRTGHEIPNGAGNQNTPAGDPLSDLAGDVHSTTANIAMRNFALADMETGADLNPQLGGIVRERTRAANRPRRSIEGGQEAAPSPSTLAAAIPFQFANDMISQALPDVLRKRIFARGRMERRRENRPQHR